MIAISMVLIALVAAGCAISACAAGRMSVDNTTTFCQHAILLYALGLVGLVLEIFL